MMDDTQRESAALPSDLMQLSRLVLLLTLTTASAAPTYRLIEPSIQVRLGYDSNPIASGGATARSLGDDSATVMGGSVSLGFETAPTTNAPVALAVQYAVDATRFEGRSSENFASHRVGLRASASAGDWSLSADASTLLVAGSRDTLESTAASNSNAITLWRERRAQWQHRLKFKAQSSAGQRVMRSATARFTAPWCPSVAPIGCSVRQPDGLGVMVWAPPPHHSQTTKFFSHREVTTKMVSWKG